VSASRGALIRVCRTPVVNFLRGGVICSVQSFFRANHISSWTFQEQTPSRFLEGCQRSMLLVGKIPMLSNIGISKLACKKHSGGVAYDRHGNALISATRLEKQGLLRHNHKRANRSQTGARPKHALDRALTTQQSFLGHPGRPGPGDISAWIVAHRGQSFTNKTFCYVIIQSFLRLVRAIATACGRPFPSYHR
jgi:hypothetical protein